MFWTDIFCINQKAKLQVLKSNFLAVTWATESPKRHKRTFFLPNNLHKGQGIINWQWEHETGMSISKWQGHPSVIAVSPLICLQLQSAVLVSMKFSLSVASWSLLLHVLTDVYLKCICYSIPNVKLLKLDNIV